MLIRAYRDSDIPAIARLYYWTVRTINARDYSPEQIAAWAPAIFEDSFWKNRFRRYRVFVAEDAGAVVGFAEFESTGHIDCFYVHHQRQSAGIGSALLRRIETEARELGLGRLFADVSVTARPFFEKKGFTVARRQEKFYGGCRFQQYLMEKYLAQPCGRKHG